MHAAPRSLARLSVPILYSLHGETDLVNESLLFRKNSCEKVRRMGTRGMQPSWSNEVFNGENNCSTPPFLLSDLLHGEVKGPDIVGI